MVQRSRSESAPLQTAFSLAHIMTAFIKQPADCNIIWLDPYTSKQFTHVEGNSAGELVMGNGETRSVFLRDLFG